MSLSYGNSWKVIFKPQSFDNPSFEEFAENFFDVVTIDYDDEGQELYCGYLSSEPDDNKMKSASAEYGIELPDYTIEFIPATNWLTKNVIKFSPIETEDFLIYGSHEEQCPNTDKQAIRIYAATAFGSGQHQTTRSCLQLLSLLNKRQFTPQNILDMGCGSGILALAACRLWPQSKALCVDIDDEAVAVTLQNAADNNLGERIHAVQSNGFANYHIAENSPYQLILANILARPLIEMAEELSQNLTLGGYAVLSGFIDEQTKWVQDTYQKFGLHCVDLIKNENWRAMLVEKNHDH